MEEARVQEEAMFLANNSRMILVDPWWGIRTLQQCSNRWVINRGNSNKMNKIKMERV